MRLTRTYAADPDYRPIIVLIALGLFGDPPGMNFYSFRSPATSFRVWRSA